MRALFNLPTVRDKWNIRNLLDEFQKKFQALESLREKVHDCDTILIYLLTSRLDNRTVTIWEETVINTEHQPSLKELTACESMQSNIINTLSVQTRKY